MEIINIAHGGYSIAQTELAVGEFHNNNPGSSIEKVFLSIGANDIRYCRANGVKHVKAPLIRLISSIRRCFPSANIFLHSLLPFGVQNVYTERNVYNFNKILFDVCSTERVYLLNLFEDFLDPWGYRNDALFESSVHPHKWAMGLIASHYIKIIHNTHFGPIFVLVLCSWVHNKSSLAVGVRYHPGPGKENIIIL